MQIQFKFNVSCLLPLRLITLALALLLGGFAQADAEPIQKDEVMSIPPQEAFYIEEKKQTPFIAPQKTTLTNRNTDTMYTIKNSKQQRDLAPVENDKKDSTTRQILPDN